MEKSTVQTFLKFVIPITVLMLLTAFSTPALADYNYAGWQVTNRVNGTVNGGVFFDYEPWVGDQSEGTTDLSHSFDVPNGTVKHAYLYTGIWGADQNNKRGWINVTFNGNYTANGLGPIYLNGTSDTNPNVWGTGLGKYWWWYNVTNLTNAGETNTAHTWKINGSIDGRVYGIVLVVIYEGGDVPKNIQYWLNDGCDSLYYDTKDAGTTDFSGTVDTGSVTEANLTLAHMTADLGCANCAKFNGHELNTSMVDSDTFELNTWNVTSYFESSGNDAWYSRGNDPYVSVSNAILVLEGKPDLKITKAWVNWTDGVGCDCTIKYIIENVGEFPSRGNFTNHLYVNGQFAASDSVVYGLSPGESMEKSFSYTWTYTPPSDDIAICADYNNTVEETDENNWYVDWLSGTTNTTWECGDVNNDKAVNILDVIMVYRRAVNPNFPLHEWAADVNEDKTINILDVIMVYRRAVNPGFGLNCWCD